MDDMVLDRVMLLVVLLKPAKGYRSPELVDLRIVVLVRRSFTEKPNGSNSIEHRLSLVNLRTYIRFKTKVGVWSTEARRKLMFGACKWVDPVPKMGKREPLPTTT
jgi:hypothetical protein